MFRRPPFIINIVQKSSSCSCTESEQVTTLSGHQSIYHQEAHDTRVLIKYMHQVNLKLPSTAPAAAIPS